MSSISRASKFSSRLRTSLLFILPITAVALYFSFIGLETTHRLVADEIKHELGHSYWIALSGSSRSNLLLRRSDTEEVPHRSELALLENGQMIGTRHSSHDSIRKLGEGRYSHWGPGLYFSTSDNTDPRSNGRSYSLRVKYFLPPSFAWLLVAVSSLCMLGGFAATMSSLAKHASSNSYVITTLISIVAVGALLCVLELSFRVSTPFREAAWPSRFYEDVGFHFAPNASVSHTNHLDFWVTEKTNSIGFLDQEPPAARADACHITFFGDSFVEAAQVPIQSKVQRLLESMAAQRHPDWRLTASAFGFSGTGQLNQLPFYEKYARRLLPRVVVLVFVSNDFANNSSLLEAVRNGWDPEHSPRVFAERKAGQWKLTPIAADWQAHVLPTPALDEHPLPLHRWLLGESVLYRWTWLKLSLQFPSLQAIGGPTLKDHMRARVEYLRGRSQFAGSFTGWEERFSEDLDRPFFEEGLPPVYRDALEATRFGFLEFKRRVEADGAKLVVLAASQMVLAGIQGKPNHAVMRLTQMLKELDIPLIDQHDFIIKQAGDPKLGQFRHDGHWTRQGHSWAADALMHWLEANQPCLATP